MVVVALSYAVTLRDLDAMMAVAIGTNHRNRVGLSLKKTGNDRLRWYIMAFVALAAHRIDLVSTVGDIRLRGPDVLVVRVRGADSMTFDASDLVCEVNAADLLAHEHHVADIARCVNA